MIDTAPGYNFGNSERIVGKALKQMDRDSILHEIDQRLERLGTDYIDVYMSHWQVVEPYYTPISETMELLNELKAQGKIRAIGAANVSPEQVEEYIKYGDLDIVQAKYSLLDRGIEADLLPLCKAHNIVLQAYSPLEMWLLRTESPPISGSSGLTHRTSSCSTHRQKPP